MSIGASLLIATRIVVGSAFAVFASAAKTTLPDWMYVTTSSQPAASKIAARLFIGSGFLPPTLMPRSSATYFRVRT